MNKNKEINERLDKMSLLIQNLNKKINKLSKISQPAAISTDEGLDNGKLLIDAIDEYYRFLHNYGVPPHEVKLRENYYINTVFRTIRILKEEITSHQRDLAKFKVSDITSEVVGWFYSGLESRGFKTPTFNNMRGNVNSFEIWLMERKYASARYFNKIKKKAWAVNPNSITKQEFNSMIKLITRESGMYKDKKEIVKFKFYYRPWLSKGLKIALELGGRMDEIINFRYNNIVEEGGLPAFIKIEDQKVNRSRKIFDDKLKKYKYLPISQNLIEILNNSGYKKKKGKDLFVLADSLKASAQRDYEIASVLRSGFNHYYRLLNTKRILTFKSLRKADVTSKFIATGGHPEFLTGHSSPTVVNKHYVDKEAVAKNQTRKGYAVFDD
ncbi:MAG TPA: hypothetical protein VK705_07370 [Ferruginibacter sp.]|jgi:integrase|nr:hypothetical protein [Ferruginibacter sp.]